MSTVEPQTEQLKYIFDNAKVGIAICNAKDNRLELVNPAFAGILGYEPHELIGILPGEVFAPQCIVQLNAHESAPSCMDEVEDVSFETIHIKKDGSEIPVSAHITMIKDDNGVVKYRIANIHDISEKKETGELLKLQKFALDHIQEAAFLLDANAQFKYANNAACQYLGYTKDEILSMGVHDIDPDYPRERWPGHWLDIRNQKSLFVETRHRHKNGNMIPVEINPNYFEYQGTGYNLALVRNISERKNAEKALHESNELYSQIFNNSSDLIFLLEVTEDERFIHLEINPAFVESAGIPKDTIVGRYVDEFADKTIRDTLIRQYKACLGAGTKMDYISEFLLPAGHKIYHSTLSPIYNDSGCIHRIVGIARDITKQKTIEKKIEFLAHHDMLTSLPNRILTKDRAEQAIAYANRNHTKAALLFIDLDGFKTINDTLGHSIGDAMLKIVSSRLNECIRATDTLGRQGGDEFLVILSDIAGENDILPIVEKLLKSFEKPFLINTHTLSISASIGIATYPENGSTYESLLQKADTAMYKAKEAGKNTYFFYTEQMNHNLIGKFKLQNDLKNALKNKEFVLHYQPQIHLGEKRIIGAEALIRWQPPQLGMIPPMDFIPIAESSGLIVQIGQWVIEEACRQAFLWHERGVCITVAVNISAVQFKRGNLESVVKEALAASKFDPRFLELELTESIMMHDVENILQTVQNLKSIGVQLSIDDFGTGYSSLAYLKRFSVDKLKIDQSFVRDILKNEEDAAIVRAIIQMAKSLNLTTIAEGVEDEHVLAVINSYECDEVQGYYFAKPMVASEFENYYTSNTPQSL